MKAYRKINKYKPFIKEDSPMLECPCGAVFEKKDLLEHQEICSLSDGLIPDSQTVKPDSAQNL